MDIIIGNLVTSPYWLVSSADSWDIHTSMPQHINNLIFTLVELAQEVYTSTHPLSSVLGMRASYWTATMLLLGTISVQTTTQTWDWNVKVCV